MFARFSQAFRIGKHEETMNVKVTDSGATLLIAGDTEEAVRLEILAR